MKVQRSPVVGLLCGAWLVAADDYADNQKVVKKDSEAVSENFPDVDMEILSPAFLDPDSVNEGFADGTAAPTDKETMGMFIYIGGPSW